MRSAGNFHPEWGYLAPAPSFMRTIRIALVATAIGATAGAAVVVSLVGRPSHSLASTSIASHALVRSVDTAHPAVTSAPSINPLPAAAVSSQPAVQSPAAPPATNAAPAQVQQAIAPSAPLNSEATVAGVVAAAPVAASSPVEAEPPAVHAATPLIAEDPPAKKTATRKHHVAGYDARRFQPTDTDAAKRRWREDAGFGPLLHLFSSRAGSSYYPN